MRFNLPCARRWPSSVSDVITKRARQIGQVGLRVVALGADHQRVDPAATPAYSSSNCRNVDRQRGLPVVSFSERHEDGLLFRRAGHRIAERALQVFDHTIRAVELRLGGVRVAAHDAAEEAQESGHPACGS